MSDLVNVQFGECPLGAPVVVGGELLEGDVALKVLGAVTLSPRKPAGRLKISVTLGHFWIDTLVSTRSGRQEDLAGGHWGAWRGDGSLGGLTNFKFKYLWKCSKKVVQVRSFAKHGWGWAGKP